MGGINYLLHNEELLKGCEEAGFGEYYIKPCLVVRREQEEGFEVVYGSYEPTEYVPPPGIGEQKLSAPARAILALRELQQKVDENRIDEEVSHIEADKILCEFLRELGQEAVVEAFEDLDKWYA
jgi:hypothetical protein